MITTDYHLHSKYSVDSQAELTDICEAAIAQGLKEIVVTDHMDLHREESDIFEVVNRQKEIDQLNQQYKGVLTIQCGMELGHPYFQEEAYQALPHDMFDFIIGSVHNTKDDVDLNDIDFTKVDIYAFIEEYIIELMRLVDHGGFDVLGHITLPLNFYYRVKDEPVDKERVAQLYRPLFAKIIPLGIGIEVNTSGNRKAVKDFYPHIQVLKLYKEMGGYILTTGSDGHRPEDIGFYFHELQELLHTVGFEKISTYTKRIRSEYIF